MVIIGLATTTDVQAALELQRKLKVNEEQKENEAKLRNKFNADDFLNKVQHYKYSIKLC